MAVRPPVTFKKFPLIEDFQVAGEQRAEGLGLGLRSVHRSPDHDLA